MTVNPSDGLQSPCLFFFGSVISSGVELRTISVRQVAYSAKSALRRIESVSSWSAGVRIIRSSKTKDLDKRTLSKGLFVHKLVATQGCIRV